MKKCFQWNKNYIIFLVAVIFYVLFVAVFVFFMKKAAAEYLLQNIDRRLLIVAKSIPLILPADYHDRAIAPAAIKNNEWRAVEKKLTKLADASGVKYAWTDVLINGRVFMTSCNSTEQTNAEGLELYYFMPYPEGVSNDEFAAFQGMKPVFADFQDRWGTFRAVFIPYRSPGGKKYLACAEYTIDYVTEILNQTKIAALLIAVVLFMAFLPVFIVYIVNSKKEAKKLEESRLNLGTTLQSIGEGVIVADTDGKIVMINPAAEKITGWSSEEALGNHIDGVFSFKQINLNDYFHTVCHPENETEREKLNWSASLRTKDNSKKIISHSTAPIKNAAGDVSGSVTVFRDISDIIKLENELRQSQKMESIGQLAGGIAHDFNNMLGAIIGSAELIILNLADISNIKQNIDIILKASEKASDMTHKLLAFSRKAEVKKEIIDIHKCIENSCCLLQRSIDRKIEIKTVLTADEHWILGDFTLIENALLNLAINARDAMPEGGIILFETKNVIIDDTALLPNNFSVSPGNFIMVDVTDSGSGIPEKIRDKIFEPFFTTKDSSKGTGLGLSLIYGAVKEHDGAIELLSEEGKGTTFRLYIPVTKEQAGSAKGPKSIHKGKGCVLFVDDEELILLSVTNLLKSMSYNVIAAYDGFEALELYEKNKDKISIAIIDLIMPRMSGFDLFHRLREIDPDLNIILSSGLCNEATMNELMRSGAAGIVMKPYTSADLSSVLQKIEDKTAHKEVD